MTEIQGLPARRAALSLLDAVLRRGQALEVALTGATRGIDNPADRALAHAIASETLRHIPDLDDLIDGATRQRLPDDAKARMVLRLALTQALVLGTPPHAAIATALPLLEGGPRRLVHGVLGTLFRAKAQLRPIPLLPPKVEARWAKAWGQSMIGHASQALAAPPPLDLTLRNPDETAHWAAALGGESLAPGHVRVINPAGVTELPGFAEGAWWVQNLSASVPARLLGQGEGRTVLDLCAAPGGKTMQLAAAGWSVTAVEREPRRLDRLKENLARTGLEAQCVAGDVFKWQPDAPVDAILLDAPCSATGIFARHPDVLHRIRTRDITQLAEVQARMVARVADWLKPGGRLVYATCSLEPEEGEKIAEQAAKLGLTTLPITPDQLPLGFAPSPEGWVRILPGAGGDGFFIVAFTRG
ncbi:MAG: RsmB/NOP family class I SAM-dependent RNA methyltransferase [Chakrabartia sp.]